MNESKHPAFLHGKFCGLFLEEYGLTLDENQLGYIELQKDGEFVSTFKDSLSCAKFFEGFEFAMLINGKERKKETPIVFSAELHSNDDLLHAASIDGYLEGK